jgi:hypothetical protein
MDGETYFKASQGLEMSHAFDGGVLTVSGFMIDRIRSLGTICSSSRQTELVEEFLSFWMTFPIDTTPYHNELHRIEVFARTLSILAAWANPVPNAADVPGMFYRWCKNSNIGERMRASGFDAESSKNNGDKRPFFKMMRLTSWEPFVTERGYIGLARKQCSEGDEVWIIAGSSVPILLSPISADSTQRETRGEVFLDGAMFGEMVGPSLSRTQTVSLV